MKPTEPKPKPWAPKTSLVPGSVSANIIRNLLKSPWPNKPESDNAKAGTAQNRWLRRQHLRTFGKRGRPTGSISGSNSVAAFSGDAVAPSALLGPSLQVRSYFAASEWIKERVDMDFEYSFKEKDEMREESLAKIPGLLDVLLQVIYDWPDVEILKEHSRARRARTLGVNCVVTGFGNEFEALGSNDFLKHQGEEESKEWWYEEDGLFNLDEEGRTGKQQCAVAASNIIRNSLSITWNPYSSV